MKYFAFVLLLLVGACETGPKARPEVEIRTVRVEVPVVQKCDARKKIGPPIKHTDTDEALNNVPGATLGERLYNKVKLLLAGREERKSREEVLERAVDACAS